MAFVEKVLLLVLQSNDWPSWKWFFLLLNFEVIITYQYNFIYGAKGIETIT